MRGKAVWRCPECKMEAHFKGLCRDCSEYDDSGEVLKPISRIRHNADGSLYVRAEPTGVMPSQVTLEMMRAARKNQRRLTKKQKKMREEQEKAMQAAMKAEAEAAKLLANEEGVLEIGESEEE